MRLLMLQLWGFVTVKWCMCVCVCHTCCVRAPNVTGWKGNKLLLCWGKMICHMTVVETRLTDFLWLSELRWSRITPPSAALPTLCVNSLLNVYKVCVFVLNASCCPELFHCTEFYLTWHLFTCPHSTSAQPFPAGSATPHACILLKTWRELPPSKSLMEEF